MVRSTTSQISGLSDRFILVTGDAQIEEFSRVTRNPGFRSRIHPAQAGRMLNAIRSLAVNIGNLPIQSISRDPHDDYLFALAQSGAADFMATGDKAHVLAVGRHGKTQIVTARQLAEILKLS